jgi:hypothetical protein
MSSQQDYIIAMERVVRAARCLVYVQDNLPGADLGQRALAVSGLELRASLSALLLLEGDDPRFDAKAALEELIKQYSRK